MGLVRLVVLLLLAATAASQILFYAAFSFPVAMAFSPWCEASKEGASLCGPNAVCAQFCNYRAQVFTALGRSPAQFKTDIAALDAKFVGIIDTRPEWFVYMAYGNSFAVPVIALYTLASLLSNGLARLLGPLFLLATIVRAVIIGLYNVHYVPLAGGYETLLNKPVIGFMIVAPLILLLAYGTTPAKKTGPKKVVQQGKKKN